MRILLVSILLLISVAVFSQSLEVHRIQDQQEHPNVNGNEMMPAVDPTDYNDDRKFRLTPNLILGASLDAVIDQLVVDTIIGGTETITNVTITNELDATTIDVDNFSIEGNEIPGDSIPYIFDGGNADAYHTHDSLIEKYAAWTITDGTTVIWKILDIDDNYRIAHADTEVDGTNHVWGEGGAGTDLHPGVLGMPGLDSDNEIVWRSHRGIKLSLNYPLTGTVQAECRYWVEAITEPGEVVWYGDPMGQGSITGATTTIIPYPYYSEVVLNFGM